MKTVQFLKEHVAADGKQFRKGEVAAVDDGAASELMRAGIVKLRNPPAPVERKGGT